MTANIEIRPATVADVETIHAMIVGLARATGKSHAVTSTPEDFAREGFGSSPAFEAIMAFEAGEPIGLALFFPEFSTWRGRRGIYLQDLYVDPRRRGTGLGRRLVQAVASRAASSGAIYVRLSADAENESAARFYRRLGFAATSDRAFLLIGEAFNTLRQADSGP